LHLAQDFCAQEVAFGAGFDEGIERDGPADVACEMYSRNIGLI